MKLEVIQADITEVAVDAIVNAANSSLLGGGGVDGAIHRKGGPAILEGCQAIRARQGKCRVGEAVVTVAGNLPAKHVIHTVGPHWNGGKKKEAATLASCYTNALLLCVEVGAKTVAFPNISTGIYGYPKEAAAETALVAVRSFEQREAIDRLIFVCFDTENYELYQNLLS